MVPGFTEYAKRIHAAHPGYRMLRPVEDVAEVAVFFGQP